MLKCRVKVTAVGVGWGMLAADFHTHPRIPSRRLQALAEGAAGTFGPLDPQRLVFHGWSGGASMVSWMFQQQMAGWEGLANIGVKAGIFLSGGSHDCYEDTPATLQRTVSVCQVVSGHPDLRAHFGD